MPTKNIFSMFSVLCRRSNGISNFIQKPLSNPSFSVHILSRTRNPLQAPSLSRPALRNIRSKKTPPAPVVDKLGFRHLLKPALFTATICVSSYAGAAIWNYERVRSDLTNRMEGFSEFTAKSGQFRNRMNFWFGSLQPGEKVAAGIIAVNVAVFLLWRVAPATVMYKWFAASPYTTTSCWPMLFSSFSHYSPLHILANMCVLWSFAAPVSHRLGPEQLLAFYLSAGVVSVFGSYAFKIARMTAVPSLGASGAICGLIGYQCWVNPESQLAILFVNQIIPHSFSAKSGLIALMTFDLMGIVFRWKVLDHAGHLAGVLFGIFYANYAQTLWSKRVSFVKWYHGIRNKFS